MAILEFPAAPAIALNNTPHRPANATAVVMRLTPPHPAQPDSPPAHVMARPDSYTYTETAAPGANIHRLRLARRWSIYDLARACRPELHASTINRAEHNQGYTSDSLHRIAAALGVSVEALFYPPEIATYAALPPDVRQRLTDTIQDAAAAYETRRRTPPRT